MWKIKRKKTKKKYIFKELRSLELYDIDPQLTSGLILKENQTIHSIHYQSNANNFNKSIGYNNFTVLVVIEETVEEE